MDVQHQGAAGMGARGRLSGSRRLGRVAAVAALAAVLVIGLELTRQLLPEARSDDLGPLFAIVIAIFWLVAAGLVSTVVLPTWLGSRSIRRLLGVCSLAGFGAALHWMSYEPGDVAGAATGITVAVLLATATAAALLAERAP